MCLLILCALCLLPLSAFAQSTPPLMPSGSNDSMTVIHPTPGIQGQVQRAVVGHVGFLRDGLATSPQDLAGHHLTPSAVLAIAQLTARTA